MCSSDLQESEFVKTTLNYLPADTVAGLPFLVEVDKQNYVAITEACIDDYPGFYIGKGNSAQDWLPDFLHCPERRKME